MRSFSILAACVIALVLAIGAAAYFSGNLERVAPEGLREAALKLLPSLNPPEPPPESTTPTPFHLARKSELIVQHAAETKTPYGTVKVAAGTRVIALREADRGIVTSFNGREVVLPSSAFGFPSPPPPQLEQKQPSVARSAPSAEAKLEPSAFPISFPPSLPPALEAPPILPEPAKMSANSPTVAKLSKWLLVADGAEGRGSGSIISWRGVPTLVTNAHVISGNRNVRFRRLNSQELNVGELQISDGYDLALFSQTDLTDGLPMMEDVDRNAAIDDDVIVLGNSLGSNVITEIPGKIKGIGPDLIEVDAKFVEGNSGSPIVHVRSGKVIAIATFATVRKLSTLDEDSQFKEVRRFGYRLDTAARWEPVALPRFEAEAEKLKQLRHRTDALWRLAVDVYKNRKVSVGIHQQNDNPLRQPVSSFLEESLRPKASPADLQAARGRFLRTVLTLCQSDPKAENESSISKYHQKLFEEERESRKFLEEKFASMVEMQEALGKVQFH